MEGRDDGGWRGERMERGEGRSERGGGSPRNAPTLITSIPLSLNRYLCLLIDTFVY
jgi:hypothetical protein